MTGANLVLSLVWVVAGAIIGALAAAARLDGRGAQTPLNRAWAKVALGAFAALLGGWLGVFVVGRLFSTATALWVSALCAGLAPWLIQRGWRRASKTAPVEGGDQR